MTDFKDRPETKKGDVGEGIVDDRLTKLDYTIYKPITDNAHSFDRLVMYKKGRVCILEVKSKTRRKLYPDTGIDHRSYLEYRNKGEKLNLPVILLFVDEDMKTVYGNTLSKLEEEITVDVRNKKVTYPLLDRGIIYFHLSKMKKFFTITADECELLKEYTTKKNKYK